MSRHSVFKGISRIIRKRSSMHSLSFSGGPTPPTIVLISLLKLPRTTEHPNRLIARLEYNRRPKGWPAGFPALPLASFDAEESAAEEPGRGSGYPPPPLYGRNARYPRYFRVEKLHPGALSLFLFLFSVSYRLVEDTFFHDAFIYVYIYARHWDRGKRTSLSWRKKVFARENEHPRNEFNGFAYFSNVSVLPMNWKFYSRFEKECSYQRLLKFYYFEYFSFRAR